MSEFEAGVAARERFRRSCKAQGEIFRDIVLYTPPDAEINPEQLLREFSIPILAAAKEYRQWLKCHPDAHSQKP
jgi:hypothetical protein